MKMQPKIVQPLTEAQFLDVQNHIQEIRRGFDWPGIPYHDAEVTNHHEKFNRWYWNNLPLLTSIHHSTEMIKLASDICGQPMKPSYCFLSMYGPEGICPLHTDRPQCQFTIDLQISSDGSWPIYVDDVPYELKDSEALCYSGTGQPHYRKAMKEESKATFMNLAFFHFVPVTFMGKLN